MGEYSKYISPKRRSQPTPHSIVRQDGICEFGTFDKEFKDLDLLRAKKPTSSPQRCNKKRLTLWEAIEIHFAEGIFFAAVSDMHLFGTTLNLFFDKRKRKLTRQLMTNLKSKDTVIAPNLLDGSTAEARHKNGFIKIVNNMESGKIHLQGKHEHNSISMEYDFYLTRISKPSVVSIPFGENRPLYTQKDLFAVEGKLILDGEEIIADSSTTAIMDDHRGYYPKKMHYDWLSTMTKSLNGKEEYFAFNLTANQSLHQEDYNENLIWLQNETSLLPPVTFTKNRPIKEYKKGVVWQVKDEHDMVNATFAIDDSFKLVVRLGVIDIQYYIVFGSLQGYLRDEDGNKIMLDGLTAMGEDKSMFF